MTKTIKQKSITAMVRCLKLQQNPLNAWMRCMSITNEDLIEAMQEVKEKLK